MAKSTQQLTLQVHAHWIAKEVAPYFRVSAKRANEIIEVVKKSVDQWRALAEKHGISKTERDTMARAFTLE